MFSPHLIFRLKCIQASCIHIYIYISFNVRQDRRLSLKDSQTRVAYRAFFLARLVRNFLVKI